MFIVAVSNCKQKKANYFCYRKQLWGFQKVIKKFMYLRGTMDK